MSSSGNPVVAAAFEPSSYAEQGVNPTVYEFTMCNGEQCEYVEEILFSSANHRFHGEKSRHVTQGTTSYANQVKRTQNGLRASRRLPGNSKQQGHERCIRTGPAALSISRIGGDDTCPAADPNITRYSQECS